VLSHFSLISALSLILPISRSTVFFGRCGCVRSLLHQSTILHEDAAEFRRHSDLPVNSHPIDSEPPNHEAYNS
jgi:hypothetical protein